MEESLRVGIIGASASGLYTALLLARKNPHAKITILEQTDKVGKKILATGNGHCNLMHVPFSPQAFNHPDFVSSLLRHHSEEDMLNALKQIGILTLAKGELLYPLSYSASAHVANLVRLANASGIDIRLGEKVEAVRAAHVQTSKGTYDFDKLVFAFGGKSQPNLGSDGSMFDILEMKGYSVRPLRPSLCPLKSPDVPKSLFGVRHTAHVMLKKDNETLYEEEFGEVLFRKDGLSGIAVMNASSKLVDGAELHLDLLPDIDGESLIGLLSDYYQSIGDGFLAAFFDKPLAEYLLNRSGFAAKKGKINEKFLRVLALHIKDLRFKDLTPYGFNDSQVTRGGISLGDLTTDLQSKIIPSQYFVGECIDIDGLCGGYNLGFALLSALTAVDVL